MKSLIQNFKFHTIIQRQTNTIIIITKMLIYSECFVLKNKITSIDHQKKSDKGII